jgi:hypothetical protein
VKRPKQRKAGNSALGERSFCLRETGLEISTLEDHERRHPVVPGVSAAEAELAQVSDALGNGGAAVAEVAVVEDADAGSSIDLDGGDVAAEVAGEPGQLIASADAELVAAEGSGGEEAGSATGIGTLVPARVPGIVLRAIDPGIILRRPGIVLGNGGNGEDQDEKCKDAFHLVPPGVGWVPWRSGYHVGPHFCCRADSS